MAGVLQLLASKAKPVEAAVKLISILPVPATALVLLVVICAVVPQLGLASGSVLRVAPIYVAFAVMAPIAG